MIHLLSIGYAKRTLEIGSREHERQMALAEGLAEHVMVVFTRTRDTLPAQTVTGRLRVFGTNARSTLGMLVRAWRIARAVLKASPSTQWVITAQDPFATSLIAWPLARLTGQPFHLQLHGDNFGNPAWRRERRRNRILFYIGCFMVRRASRVRVVAKRQIAPLVALGVPRERIVVLPVYISLEAFLAVGRERATLAPAPLKLLYAGRFSPEKGLPAVLAALKLVHTAGLPVTLTLLGAGSEEGSLRAFVAREELETVINFVPWSNDVAAVYAAHDVFILNSAHEGYALVLLEAAAAGLAIISTDVGCVGDVLQPEKELLLTNGSPESIAAAITTLQDSSRRSLLARAAHAVATKQSTTLADYQAAWLQSFHV